MNAIELGGWVTLAFGLALQVLFWLLFGLRKWGRPLGVRRPGVFVVMVVGFTLSILLIVIALSLFMQVSKFAAIGYVPVMAAMTAIYIYSVIAAVRKINVPNWLKEFWNVEKAFGGFIFADFASTIGLLGGVGAYRLRNQDEAWFWLGLVGALLATLVGLSLGLRSLLVLDEDPAHSRVPPRTSGRWMRWFALGNLLIGVFTLLSVTSPAEDVVKHTSNFDLVRAPGLRWPLDFIVPLVMLNVAYFMAWFYFDRRHNQNYTWDEHLPWWLMAVASLGTVIAMILNMIYVFPDWMPAFFGACAFLVWLIMEFGTLVQLRLSSFIRTLRGVLIILGSLVMIFLLIWIEASLPSAFDDVHWFWYSEAFVLIALGALLGMVVGTIALALKDRAQQHAAGAPAHGQAGQAAPAGNLDQDWEASSVDLSGRQPPKKPAQNAGSLEESWEISAVDVKPAAPQPKNKPAQGAGGAGNGCKRTV